MIETELTMLCAFGGSGGGGLGFAQAEPRLFDVRARWRVLGSIDIDEEACRDFERIVGAPAYCIDVEWLTAAQLVAHYGPSGPDCVLLSAPCKGSSRLLSAAKAKSAKYKRLNRLSLVFTRTMLEAWRDDPPALVLLENVPGLPTRAQSMLRELRSMLRKAGYVFHQGFHDCGELGGLAQHRKRFLLVARHPKKCAALLYKPPKRRVRGCGEVLSELPMPATVAAREWGSLHEMPKLTWRNWLRLALIPAGGDWRDLEGVLAEGQARREVMGRHRVEPWTEPTGAIAGPGSNGVCNVADPRIVPRTELCAHCGHDRAAHDLAAEMDPREIEHSECTACSCVRFVVADPGWHRGGYGVSSWADPTGVITGGADNPSRGRFSIADPRAEQLALKCEPRPGAGSSKIDHRPVSIADPRVAVPPGPKWAKHHVAGFDEPVRTVIGGRDNGARAVADPRASGAFCNVDRVRSWDEPTGTITSSPAPSSGRPAVADPRVPPELAAELRVERAYDAGYGVLGWSDSSRTVAGKNAVGCGAYAVADPRERFVEGARVLTLDEALALDVDPSKRPKFIPVIIARDGTWHRPLTLLELAVLQSYPARIAGRPIRFEGTRTSQAEHIGNSIPAAAMRATAEQMGIALLQSRLEAFALSSSPVWVSPEAMHA